MAVRDTPADAGKRDASRLLETVRRDLRDSRVRAGLSQASVARAAGLSPSAYGRVEVGDLKGTTVEALAVSARAVGLALWVRLYPEGTPVRDAGQLRLERDFASILGPGLSFRSEVLLPIAGDLRAWDGIVSCADGLAFAECEMRLGDVQELLRRYEAKLRDDPRSRILILVVRATRHNRRVLAEHREVLRPLLPLDSGTIMRSLRSGRLPASSGVLVI
jgi:transcriptional regulator with XRE-family HTH domain